MIARLYDNEKLKEISDELNSGSFLTLQDLLGKQFINFSKYLYKLEIFREKNKLVIRDKLSFNKELPLDSNISFGGNSLIVSTKSKDIAFMIISNSASLPDKYYEFLMGNYINNFVRNRVSQIRNSEIFEEYSGESSEIVEGLLSRISEANLVYLSEVIYKNSNIEIKIKIDLAINDFMEYLEESNESANINYKLEINSSQYDYNSLEDIVINILDYVDKNIKEKSIFNHQRYE